MQESNGNWVPKEKSKQNDPESLIPQSMDQTQPPVTFNEEADTKEISNTEEIQADVITTTTSVTLSSGLSGQEGLESRPSLLGSTPMRKSQLMAPHSQQNWDTMEPDDFDAKAEEAFALLAGVDSAERILRLLLKRHGLGSGADKGIYPDGKFENSDEMEARIREEHRLEIQRLQDMYNHNTLLLNEATMAHNFLTNILKMQLRFEKNGYRVFWYMPFSLLDADQWSVVMTNYVFHGWKQGLWQLRALRLEEEKQVATTELAKTQEAQRIQSEALSREKEKNKAMEEKAAQDLKERRNIEGELQMTKAKQQDLENKCASAQKEAQKAKEEAAAQIETMKKEIEATIAESKAELTRAMETLKEEHAKKMEETTRQFQDTIAKRENDMKAMKTQISKISAEMAQAMATAADAIKTLKSERKAHQDMMKNASPDALAKLMAELNQLNEKLKAFGFDVAEQKSQKEFFKNKLNQNVRRLMLERQFLPLIHGVGEFPPEQLLGTQAKDKSRESKKLRGNSMGDLQGPAGGGRQFTDSRSPPKQRRLDTLGSLSRTMSDF